MAFLRSELSLSESDILLGLGDSLERRMAFLISELSLSESGILLELGESGKGISSGPPKALGLSRSQLSIISFISLLVLVLI